MAETDKPDLLIPPYGGKLVNLLVSEHVGKIKGYTGIDDPYETPVASEIVVNTTDCSPEDSVRQIIRYSLGKGFLLGEFDEQDYDLSRVDPVYGFTRKI
jgi:hypothetical protein